jgi:K+-sensing histidine kinase KdpD
MLDVQGRRRTRARLNGHHRSRIHAQGAGTFESRPKVDAMSYVQSHRWVVNGCAVVAPFVVAAALAAVRFAVTSTTAALVLVLVVVGAAATGQRTAGIVAALSSGAWYDFFLTEPYGSFKVTDTDDLQATVLLLLVGVAVSEIAWWGRRQQARASRRAGYLDGVLGTADIVALRQDSSAELIDRVNHQIVQVLDIDACRFAATGVEVRSATTLQRDGSVERRGQQFDVDRHGLPTDDLITLDVSHNGAHLGRFVLTASTRSVRPTVEQRRVVVLLADQVGGALANSVP